MTYRLDSDIPDPHGWFVTKVHPDKSPVRMDTLLKWKSFDRASFEDKMKNNTFYHVIPDCFSLRAL